MLDFENVKQFVKDLWRCMLDHPWVTTLVAIPLNIAAPPLILAFWIAVGIDRSKNK